MTEATTAMYAHYSGNRSARINRIDGTILSDAVLYFERAQLDKLLEPHAVLISENIGWEGRQ